MAESGDKEVGFYASGNWTIVAARVRGPSHEKDDKPCDDSFAFAVAGEWVVGVVCDGAGSARHGGEGAILTSSFIADELAERVRARAPCNSLRRIIETTISEAREALTQIAAASDAALRDYHTTVVGVVARRGKGVLFHIGDGAAVCFRKHTTEKKAWVESGLSPPTNGEFAETTFFVTEKDWRSNLAFVRVKGTDAIALMTDGVTGFALAAGEASPDLDFFGSVNEFLMSNATKKGARSLFKLLGNAQCRRASGDDKALVWISGIPNLSSAERTTTA